MVFSRREQRPLMTPAEHRELIKDRNLLSAAEGAGSDDAEIAFLNDWAERERAKKAARDERRRRGLGGRGLRGA